MMSRKITATSVFRIKDALVSCRHGEETFVLQVDSGRYLGMDSVGTTIWEYMLEQPRSFSEICDYVLQEFDVSVEECRAGVTEMLEQLLSNELIALDESVS